MKGAEVGWAVEDGWADWAAAESWADWAAADGWPNRRGLCHLASIDGPFPRCLTSLPAPVPPYMAGAGRIPGP